MTRVEGEVAPGFEQLRDAFGRAHGESDGGAQLSVFRQGRPVVDIWVGRDDVNDRPFGGDSLSMVYSCTKGVVATCVAILVDRRLIDLDAPVARYWPEYAVAGKESTTVAQLMSHQAGLPAFSTMSGLTIDDLPDWDRCARALAAATPLWRPGAAVQYHAFTFGYLAGELVRRITGRTVGEFFAENVAAPLGLEFWIGLPEELEPRVAPSALDFDPARQRETLATLGVDVTDPVMMAILDDPTVVGLDAFLNTRAGHAVQSPGANGIGTARALAKMYAACIGEVDGIRLFSPETLQVMRTSQTRGVAPAVPPSARPDPDDLGFGIGYWLGIPTGVPTLGIESFGHHGAGGRLGFAHPPTGTTFSYTCTRMWGYGPNPRWAWSDALRSAVLG